MWSSNVYGGYIVKHLSLFLVLISGCDSGTQNTGPCAAVSGSCVSFAKGASEAEVQTAFGRAKAGTTFLFAEGTFKFANELTVTSDNITVKGAGIDKTVLDYTNQTAGSEGMLAMNNGFTISDLTVLNAKGNGIKVVGATGVTFRKVRVTWNDPDNHKHGPYALYPVQCKNVLIEDNLIEGAADAGIYVGQSEKIVVRRNTATGNVAGIEIENSAFADVYENVAHDNCAGILVFSLPDLQVKDGHDIRLYDNNIYNNNTNNFATPGTTVNVIPAGTGTFVMGAGKVEVFGNTFKDNKTANFSVISYLASGEMINDAAYYPYTTEIYIHDNTFIGGGDAPDTTMGFPSIGGFLSISMPKFPGMKVADILLDGLVDKDRMGTTADNPMDICIQNNGAATFINLHFDMLSLSDGFVAAEANSAPYDCTLQTLPAVTFPGLD
jgi:parallel beta-helix repeat protein